MAVTEAKVGYKIHTLRLGGSDPRAKATLARAGMALRDRQRLGCQRRFHALAVQLINDVFRNSDRAEHDLPKQDQDNLVNRYCSESSVVSIPNASSGTAEACERRVSLCSDR